MRRFRIWHKLLGHNFEVKLLDHWKAQTDCLTCGDRWTWWRFFNGSLYYRNEESHG